MDGRPADVEVVVLGAIEGKVALDLSVVEEDIFGELTIIEKGVNEACILKVRFLAELRVPEVGGLSQFSEKCCI